MLPYSFLAAQATGSDITEAHQYAYTAIAHLPKEAQTTLLAGNTYNKTLSNSPAAMAETSTFYSQRVGFIDLLAVTTYFKIPPFKAFQLINLIATLLTGLVLWRWLQKIFSAQWVPTILFCILALIVTLRFGRTPTPDHLMGAFLLAGTYLTLYRNPYLGIASWLGSTLLRPQVIIFLFPYGIWLLWKLLKEKDLYFFKQAAVLLLVGIAAIIIHFSFPHPGLATLQSHAWGELNPFPLSQPVTFNWQNYCNLITERFFNIHGREFFMLACISLFGGYAAILGTGIIRLLSLSTLAFLTIQYLMFPALWPRLVIAPTLILFMLAGTAKATLYKETLAKQA